MNFDITVGSLLRHAKKFPKSARVMVTDSETYDLCARGMSIYHFDGGNNVLAVTHDSKRNIDLLLGDLIKRCKLEDANLCMMVTDNDGIRFVHLAWYDKRHNIFVLSSNTNEVGAILASENGDEIESSVEDKCIIYPE